MSERFAKRQENIKIMRMNPLISFVIPTFNCLSYLKPCLESIEKIENREQLEIIIINDGSSDGTKEYLDSLKRPNYKIIHQENGGVSCARNRGIKEATGQYLYFCDSDDEIIYQNFSKFIPDISNGEYDLFVCSFLNEKFDKTTSLQYKKTTLGLMTGEEFLHSSLKNFTFGGEGPQYIIKRDLWGELEFPLNRIHEDDFIYPSLILSAEKVLVSNTPIYYRKFREGSLTKKAGKKINFSIEDQLHNIEIFKKKLSQAHNERQRQIFETLIIRSWIYILHFLKEDPDNEKFHYFASLRPGILKTSLNSSVLSSYRFKYFRRSIKF